LSSKYPIWNFGWIADCPDDGNFMQLLSALNVNQRNATCCSSPQHDAVYRQSQLMGDSPEVAQFFKWMDRQFEADTPRRPRVASYRSVLVRPRTICYKAHPVLLGEMIYVDTNATRTPPGSTDREGGRR
jgi:hypothetical protein